MQSFILKNTKILPTVKNLKIPLMISNSGERERKFGALERGKGGMGGD